MGEKPADDDATLIRHIAENQDERALAELLVRHTPKVTGDLRCRFRHALQHADNGPLSTSPGMPRQAAGRVTDESTVGEFFIPGYTVTG